MNFFDVKHLCFAKLVLPAKPFQGFEHRTPSLDEFV
jgi:hypothetical protein